MRNAGGGNRLRVRSALQSRDDDIRVEPGCAGSVAGDGEAGDHVRYAVVSIGDDAAFFVDLKWY